jgi:futalosine hydrolase
MPILLCAATSFEILPTIEYLQKKGMTDRVHILITGVGSMETTYHLTKKINAQQYSMIIQAGIAGSIDKNIDLQKTVLVGSETIGDAGVWEKNIFRSLADLGLSGKNEWPWKENKLVNDNTSLKELNFPVVNGVTVQQITTDYKQLKYYERELGAQIESLEGAALHYVGLREKVPFLQLRTISNYAGERNKKEWRLDGAVSQLNKDLQSLLYKTWF